MIVSEDRTFPITADWVLAGSSRLITCAPGVCQAAVGRLGVIEHGALAARAGRIVWVGPEKALAQAVNLPQIPHHLRLDAGGCAVLPGFVDSHTHFIFAGNRAEEFQLRHSGVSYEEIARSGGGILNTVRATRAADTETLRALGRRRLQSFAAHGTTTVEGKTGYGLDTVTEERCLDIMHDLAGEPGMPDIIPSFLGAHTFPPEYLGNRAGRERYVASICEEMLPAFVGKARFCDVFCEQTAFSVPEARRILARARDLGYWLKLHANQLGATGGAHLAAEFGAVSADHLDFASAHDLQELADAGVTATLLPGCAFTLGTPYPQWARFREAGLHVALATDFNPGTSYCENMQTILAFAVNAMHATLEEALLAATIGGARALGLQGEIGSLEPGKRCDLIVLTSADERELAYHFGVNMVAQTVLSGSFSYRRA
ncbi:MAG: imidazolonepropionase [Ktedonobacterales bacterium]